VIRRIRSHSPLAVVAGGVLLISLALSGCSSDDDAGGRDGGGRSGGGDATAHGTDADIAVLKGVTVTGDAGSAPTLTFDQPLTVTAVTTLVVDQGTGAPIEDGQSVTFNAASVMGTDGSTVYSTWDSGSTQDFVMGADGYDTLSNPLAGANVGARVLVANPTTGDVTGTGTADDTVTVVTIFEVVNARTLPSRAEGEAVTPEAGLPTVTLADNGAPSIDIPSGYEPGDDLVVQTLIKGAGAEVSADQSVTVNYTGWLLDGTVFDSSWESGNPISFPLTGVIQGWTQGLTGQTVGSQVLLVIPPDLAYGDQESGSIPGGSTLIFVVDILDAQ
jgi:peptidylprolyl isomerase